jgi:subtilase family serine protease
VPTVQPPPSPTPLVTATALPTNTPGLTVVPPTATLTPGPADLLVTNIVGSNALTLGAGSSPVTSSYTVTITNNGTSATGQFNNTIAVSPGGASTPLGVVASLGGGESIVLNVSLTFSTAGTYSVQAQVDSDSQVTELSEVNNVGLLNVTVNAPP